MKYFVFLHEGDGGIVYAFFDNKKEAEDYVKGESCFIIRKANWVSGRLPAYWETEVVN